MLVKVVEVPVIKEIYVKNFKSIKEETFPLTSGMNAILGSNNVGKSNLLEIIKRCLSSKWLSANSFSIEDIHKRQYGVPIVVKIIFKAPIKYKKYSYSPDTDIYGFQFEYKQYERGEKKGIYHLEQRCLNNKNEIMSTIITKKETGVRAKSEAFTSIPQELKDEIKLIYMGLPRTIESQLPSSQYSFLRIMLQDICKEIENNTDKKKEYDSLIQKLMNLLSTEHFKEIEQSIKDNTKAQLGISKDDTSVDVCFDTFSPFIFLNNLNLIFKENDFEISATELGQGIQNAIVLSIMQTYEKMKKQGAIILVEEPECFLHPQKQKYLYETFERISQTNQLIYTTHSPYFVALPNFHQIIRLIKENSETKVQNVRSEKWEEIANKLWKQREELQILKDFDTETREFFFSKAVIIVEGDTERLSLPVYANRLEFNLNAADVSIINARGKRNLYKFVQIAKTLNMKTVAFYDIDASDFNNQRDDEKDFNDKLNSLADEMTKIVALDKDYESELRETFDEQKYSEICNNVQGTKPIRACQIAQDETLDIPAKIQEAIEWLSKGAI